MIEEMRQKLEADLEGLSIEDFDPISPHRTVRVFESMIESETPPFYSPEDREKWREALHLAQEGKAKEMGEYRCVLEDEDADNFFVFKCTVEALTEKEIECHELREELAEPEVCVRHALKDIPTREFQDDPSEPSQEEFVLGEVLLRYRNNDYSFFEEIVRLLKIRGDAYTDDRRPTRKFCTPFIAHKLGRKLGRTPTRDEILERLRDLGFPIKKQNEAEVFSECHLDFLPPRKRGRKRKALDS